MASTIATSAPSEWLPAAAPSPSTGPRVLLVEDNQGLRLTLSDRLGSEGYQVQTASTGEEGLTRAAADAFDLVILDVMLPHRNGFEVCREMRERGVQTPVLMLTACRQVADRVKGLKLGADDYLTKPFEMAELSARVEARVRSRTGRAPGDLCRFGTVEVDLRGTQVRRDGVPIALSSKEFRLLRYFLSRRGVTIGRHEILDEVWGRDAMPTARTVDVHVAWLRRKLEPHPSRPRFILTVHGHGYKFVA